MKVIKYMKTLLCGWVWSLSTLTGIPLGRFAPYIFGGMIGCKGKEIKPADNAKDKRNGKYD